MTAAAGVYGHSRRSISLSILIIYTLSSEMWWYYPELAYNSAGQPGGGHYALYIDRDDRGGNHWLPVHWLE